VFVSGRKRMRANLW